MKNHTDLLNYIARKIGAKTYLEIGVQNIDTNFTKVDVRFKEGVDPETVHPLVDKTTSDEFFNGLKLARYDIVFIDGLHHADQVKRDIQNSWNCLNVGGVILVHDCNPASESITHVPRDSKEWTGDVYKTICQIVSPSFFTVDFDYGCCVIRKGNNPLAFQEENITWELFDQNRSSLLNLKSVDEAKKIIDAWM